MSRAWMLCLPLLVSCGAKAPPPPPVTPVVVAPEPVPQTSPCDAVDLRTALNEGYPGEGDAPAPRMSPVATEQALSSLLARCEALREVDYPTEKRALATYLVSEDGQKYTELMQIEVETLCLASAGDSFEARSHALYLWGQAHLDYAALVEAAPCPAEMDAASCALFEEVLVDRAGRLRGMAAEKHQVNVSIAEAEGGASVWVERSRLSLEQLAP